MLETGGGAGEDKACSHRSGNGGQPVGFGVLLQFSEADAKGRVRVWVDGG